MSPNEKAVLCMKVGIAFLILAAILGLVRGIKIQATKPAVDGNCSSFEAVRCTAKLLSNMDGQMSWEGEDGETFFTRSIGKAGVVGATYLVELEPLPPGMDIRQVRRYSRVEPEVIICTTAINPYADKYTQTYFPTVNGEIRRAKASRIDLVHVEGSYSMPKPTYLKGNLATGQFTNISHEEAESYGVTVNGYSCAEGKFVID